MNMQKGFTLIELIVVIVILGILAATAMPKFIDLSNEAAQASVNGVAGALGSASAINYGARKAAPAKGAAVTDCTSVAALLEGGALPTGYSITAAAVAVDTTVTCTVTKTAEGKTATFSATGIL